MNKSQACRTFLNPQLKEKMKIAYIFRHNMASTFQLSSMILPLLENKSHGVEVIGMMFYDDNLYVLAKGNEFGERLSKVAKEQNILLMICDQCAIRRGFGEGNFEQCGTGEIKAKGTVDGVVAGCFPQLYESLSYNQPDQVITL